MNETTTEKEVADAIFDHYHQVHTYDDVKALLEYSDYHGKFKVHETEDRTIYICIYFPFWNFAKWREFKLLRYTTKYFVEQQRIICWNVKWKRTWFGFDIIKEIYTFEDEE